MQKLPPANCGINQLIQSVITSLFRGKKKQVHFCERLECLSVEESHKHSGKAT